MGVFEICAFKAKIWGIFAGLSCCHDNFLRHKNEYFSAIMGHFRVAVCLGFEVSLGAQLL